MVLSPLRYVIEPTGRFRNEMEKESVASRRAQGVQPIPVDANLPIGVFGDYAYKLQELQLEAQSTLFLYTDGVTEAENPEEEMFSKERMLGTLGKFAGKSARSIVEGVLAEVQEHAAGRQSDDITMLCIRWREEV